MDSLPKELIVQQTTEFYEAVYEPHAKKRQGCLMWTAALITVLREKYDYTDVRLQAGTARFKFIADQNDDGVKAN